MKNLLYYGDNLDVLRRHVDDETVDLVYLDPPFKSSQDYNVLFAEHSGAKAAAQIKAFEDTWTWDEVAARAYEETVEQGGAVANAMRAFRSFLGTSDMMAYLSMMAPRLVELRRVMKPTASIYLHCDPTASHYLKILMDAVIGPKRFINEIVWLRSNAHNFKTRFWPRQHDTILAYTHGEVFTLNPVYTPYGPEQLKRYREDENGRLYTGQDLTVSAVRRLRQFEWRGIKPPAHRSWGASLEQLEEWYAEGKILLRQDGKPRFDGLKVYLDETKGKQIGSVWTDIPRISNTAAERLGYPTQKPVELLERIITASSNEGDVVLDPFCGCGTSISAAERLKRKWIGIDITHLAIGLIKSRLRDEYGDDIAKSYQVIGEPTTLEDAEELAKEDQYQFQWWALGLVGARRSEEKKGADKGIDGQLFFHDEPVGGKTKHVILSVKAGRLQAHYVRDLRGVIERESAEIGVLISMEPPTKPMRAEAASAGFYKSPYGTSHPRLQLLTIDELLHGKSIDYPAPRQTNVTITRAKRSVKDEENRRLF
jgi:site-specific DNA-methyltransferase (adenine-specific)